MCSHRVQLCVLLNDYLLLQSLAKDQSTSVSQS